MEHNRAHWFAFVGAASLTLIAGPALADAAGPYYATPSWDQQLPCTSAANCPRFVVLSNWIDLAYPSGGAAVLDRETGLVWQRSTADTKDIGVINIADKRTLPDARGYCNQAPVGGRRGFRLPTVQELMSLVDVANNNNLPPGHPFQNIQTGAFDFYWTSTVNLSGAVAIWSAVSLAGGGGTEFPALASNWVLCVRAGTGSADLLQ